MGSEHPGIPRTPPPGSLSNSVPAASHSRTVSSIESVDPALQLEWSTYSATGVACELMLTSLYSSIPPSPNKAASEALRLRLEEALSMSPEVAQYGPIANICNEILHEYYESNPPTEDRPARWFIPLGNSIPDRDFTRRAPDVVIVIRHLWEEHVRAQLEKVPISQRKDSKEWKEVFPDWEAVDDRIRNLLTNTSVLKAADLDPRLLRALAIYPPWECIVAIVEFNDSVTPDSISSTSASVSSNRTNTSENEQEKRFRSKGSIYDMTSVKSSKETPGLSPIAERGNTPLVSTETNSLQNSSANEPSAPSWAPRKNSYLEVQLLSYFCEMMSAARYRDWASGAIISDMDFNLVTCDREGAIKSAATSLRTTEGVDIFLRWVLAVGSGTLGESGFSNIFGQTTGHIDGVNFSIPGNAKRAVEGTIQLKFGKQHYQQYGAFGRGTTLYRVDITMGDEKIQGVCKISWPEATRDSECDLIQQARAVDPDHLPGVICSWDIDARNLPSRALRKDCPQAAVKYEPRVLRIVVSPLYAPIHELEGDEFFAAFWDVMLCNVKLHEANSVHHRDPSVNNMMYRRDEDGQVIGILSDFDLAVSMTRSDKPSSVHRSGTAPFMALDLLRPNACEQELEHDFESALYILLWVALGYKGWKPPNGDPSSYWSRGTWSQIYTAKRAFIDSGEVIFDLIDLIIPDYEVLRERIHSLHLTIRLRKQSKGNGRLLQRMGRTHPATPPVTAQEFFDMIDPPPPGREPYSQIKP